MLFGELQNHIFCKGPTSSKLVLREYYFKIKGDKKIAETFSIYFLTILTGKNLRFTEFSTKIH